MAALKWPATLKRVTALKKIPNVLGLFGIEYLLFIPLYAYVIQWCVDTAGEPYTAALAHYAAETNSTVGEIETVDEWNMPSWQPEQHDPFAEDEIDVNLPHKGLLKKREKSAIPPLEDDSLNIRDPELNLLDAEAEKKTEKPLPNPLLPNFWAVVALIGVVLANGLVWFTQRWIIGLRTKVQYTSAARLGLGTYAYVIPHAHQGATEIVPVESMTLPDGRDILYVTFQRQRFELNEATNTLEELDCSIDKPIGEYAKAQGIGSTKEVDEIRARYGNNDLNIPLPLLQDVFSKQMLGPIPVFQILCTGLWLMDEYWNYALFNIFSICMFEGSTAFGRLKNMSTLRGLKNKANNVMVRRGGVWVQITSEDLVPGDVFSLRNEGNEEVSVPCDILLLHGAAVLNEASLTGESTPQMKEGVTAEGESAKERLDITQAHRVHVLSSGTTLLQHTSPPADVIKRLGVPDGGAVCFCLRTGFSSSQGQLVRMIEYSSEQVMSDAKETLALLFLLLIFALLASGYVLRVGLQEGKRSQYELVLRCVLILTSVVPPELPMQTAVAVNTALLALWKTQIFCTEPFRIPYAGKVEVCLFDKTGTLTTDQLVCTGTISFSNDEQKNATETGPRAVDSVQSTSFEMCVVMGACHALVEVGGKLCGDPIETESVRAIGWDYNPKGSTCTPGKSAVPNIPKQSSCKILHRYHFSSKLQRMTVLAKVSPGKGQPSLWALVKGSPEAVAKLLAHKPAAYDATYRQMAENGMRVLALAYRPLEGEESDTAAAAAAAGRGVEREGLERGMVFAGFLAFSCKVRKDTAMVVSELQGGSHRVIMATGDAALTALYVAMKVGITDKEDPSKALLLDATANVWEQMRHKDADKNNDAPLKKRPFSATGMPALRAEGYDLCATGDALRAAAAKDPKLWDHVEEISVYARMAPEDKERVIRAMRERGMHTLMCGDGANDVGALKQAHVGVALLSGFGGANTAKEGDKPLELESEEERTKRQLQAKMRAMQKAKENAEAAKKDRAELQQMQKVWYEEELQKLEAAGAQWASVKAMKNAVSRIMQEQKARIAKRNGGAPGPLGASAAGLANLDMDMDLMPQLKLGDASIAAPFTSKLPSVMSCVDIIRQGRCTLVSTIQMQQILALNCLISAYSLSAMYLDGVRSGEAQMIASGVLLTVASLAFSYARPVKELSHVRPVTSIFHPSIFISIIGQLLIHLTCMVYTINLAKESSTAEELEEAMDPYYVPPPPPPTADDTPGVLLTPFKPSLLNTVVFLIQTAQQVSVLAVNYKGRPFMIAATENTPMLYSLALCCAGTFVAAFETVPWLNKTLQLVPMPSSEFRSSILYALALSVLGAFVWDRLCVGIFAPRLLMAGYKDAWNALPSREEGFQTLVKLVMGAFVFGLYIYTENFVILILAFYFWKQLKKQEAKMKATAETKLAGATPTDTIAAAQTPCPVGSSGPSGKK